MFKLIARMLKLCSFAQRLNGLYSYFDDPTKLLSDLYLAKFLDTLAKTFFRVQILQGNHRYHRHAEECRN